MDAIRILHVGFGEKYYGLEKIMIDMYRHIDRDRYQFDFLVSHKYGPLDYEQDIEQLGGRIYREYYKITEAGCPGYLSPSGFWDKHPEIKGIHFNLLNYGAWLFQFVVAAKRRGIPIRLIHSHNDGMPSKLLYYVEETLTRPFANKYANKLLACSEQAGRFNFGKADYEILFNGIDVDKYAFSLETRENIRKRYKLDDRLVLGFVGRLEFQKNPGFLIKVIQEVNLSCDHAVLVILGDGSMREDIERSLNSLGISNVLFMGRVSNVQEWIQAFDVLLLPSRFEGLGMVLIEAQASGLMCLASDNVPPEAAITPRFSYLSLENPADWADAICKADFVYDRRRGRNEVAAAGYDIRGSAKRLEAIYDELLNKKR